MSRILCATRCIWVGRGGWRLIRRLSAIITNSKVWLLTHTAARCGWYLFVLMALLFFWLCTDSGEIAFVYNAF